MFRLSEISPSENIVIQCHDNPDADALASAFALYTYFENAGNKARIIYSGKFEISKPNLLEMLVQLEIPAEFVKPPANFPFLIVTDAQYGAGNVTRFDAEKICVIDHHMEEKTERDTGVINSALGSCSTLVWDLLRKENFPFDKFPNVSSALYFGLFTDTGGLSEIYHPLDRDMRDTLVYNRGLIKRLQNTNVSLAELALAGNALNNFVKNDEHRFAIFKAEPCDPNILGFISDLALQVDGIDTCIVYNVLPDGAKLSIRCCARDVMASDFAGFLTRGVGSGGGHLDKAGGFCSRARVAEQHTASSRPGDILDDYILARATEYFTSYELVDAANHGLDISKMKMYRKLKIAVGHVHSSDVFPAGTPVIIRALEGDETIIAADDIYFMVGILGEVYPITAEKFARGYALSQAPSDIKINELEYRPTVRSGITGEVKELADFIRPCTARGEVRVFVAPLSRYTKVFTKWSPDSYMYGREGDFIVVREDDVNDAYIIREDIFYLTYEAV
ncbi:MAG: DHH family phosphoesterase [Defluviitaleaceae bacterium]|nr:DHH family phosphoesterase [Defluviitaleaceae bacterium]